MLTRICIAYSRISITELAFRKTGPGVPVHRRKARAGREFLVSDVFILGLAMAVFYFDVGFASTFISMVSSHCIPGCKRTFY